MLRLAVVRQCSGRSRTQNVLVRSVPPLQARRDALTANKAILKSSPQAHVFDQQVYDASEDLRGQIEQRHFDVDVREGCERSCLGQKKKVFERQCTGLKIFWT